MVRSRRFRMTRVAAPVAGLILLSGCAGVTPGTAAVVDGQHIASSRVDDLVHAECTVLRRAAAQGQGQPTPVSYLRQQALALLVDTTLSDRYARSEHVKADPAVTDALFGQYDESLAGLPASARVPLTEALKAFAESRSAMAVKGAQELGQQLDPQNPDTFVQRGLSARRAWAKHVTVDTDASFAPAKDGSPGGGSGSVSQASSTFARSAGSTQADPAWVSSLPADQRCG